MVDNFVYEFLLQVCQEVEGKQVKAKEKKIDYQHYEKRNEERMMYPHSGFYARPSFGGNAAMIYVLKEKMNQQSCIKTGNVFTKEMNIFNRMLRTS